MSDLISRQALCEYALNQKDKSVTPNDIMRFPSAQPERTCATCKYNTREWDEDPCDGCTGTESKYEPMVSPDGTLTVNVPKGTKVTRVLVQEEGTQFGGLFYPEEERKNGKWRRLPMACYGGGTVIEYQCPFCGEQFIMPSNYCQECGADMRGGYDE